MTRWKLLILVLLVIVIGVAIFLFYSSRGAPIGPSTATTNPGFGPPAQNIPSANQTSSPTAFATGFYAWYVKNLANNQGFTTSDQFKSTIKNWLTQDFALNWNTIAENTGNDPVLLTQDYQNSWITNIQATVTNQTATTSTVLVTLGTSAELHRVVVHLELANNAWRISAVTPSP